ncbi:MAG: UTP--glucose-1-phosphate uridylyltransferase [Planctomycetota bacterium]|nr:MAG: UTP--glucose-1-phosphate uridylyltransferase [Planctomycetota bacterium]REJ88837.1 MAG: UTP--glucose-1-phosphate uridylyltransferase [Planctomycetota bacterium]REK29459.1 MAG: UTP--glucose-1-phosphate uridylyltransferase [Planctomycetota bacterium]REK31824.1 MAG: UTP--glucose-1-phosphate uridylyltransferase [Planctomycetota bacterium]
MNRLIEIITSDKDSVRNTALETVCRDLSGSELLEACQSLDRFRRETTNLYQRVRALFFLSSLYQDYVPRSLPAASEGHIPFEGYTHLLERRFREAVDSFLDQQRDHGPDIATASALAVAYQKLGLQALANQVRRSVRTVAGNRWMFRLGHPAEHPLRMRRELLRPNATPSGYPILQETTAVRMDFSHSGWSDIFFLAMDYPEGARVLNASIDLGVRGRDEQPRPPIETYLRVIDRPVLRLVSIDLDCQAEIEQLPEVFDFARDYLGLLKAAVIATGLVPSGLESCEQPMAQVLEPMIGSGLGLEVVSKVNGIPKGSRLAVSTNLLGSLIALCMRATHQVSSLTGTLGERDRRTVAARCILGEWLGGSGGGWQDSGGIWPGIKLIRGEQTRAGDPEAGISRGRLLPTHEVWGDDDVSPAAREKLQRSLVLVHGGMAQNVGPILEMVTEKYLLRSTAEWRARQDAGRLLDEIMQSLREGDIKSVGSGTTRNFEGPLQTIIPWCTNYFTDQLIQRSRERFADDFWGFWMLGGMAGGGMGLIFDPARQEEAKDWLQAGMSEMKHDLETSLPFAMEPVVYDFRINDHGTWATLLGDGDARMPDAYYALMAPNWIRAEPRQLTPLVRRELESLSDQQAGGGLPERLRSQLLTRLLPQPVSRSDAEESLETLLDRNGFDPLQHEQIRADLRASRIGLSQNRLPPNTQIEDVREQDVTETRDGVDDSHRRLGEDAIRQGETAVVTLAAGAGSRWTEGAGVVKALHPFSRFAGRHRRFLEVHLAKTRQTNRRYDASTSHVFTTSYLTDEPVRRHLADVSNYGLDSPVLVSPGAAVGLRMIPMVRDLRFSWEETAQELLDEQQQKLRESLRSALVGWARSVGEAADYTDNLPLQCLHPVGHWYEMPNLLRNGTLNRLLNCQPNLKYLLLHNIDTLGADLDAGLLGLHIARDNCLSYEVVARRLEDRGGGLARIDGRTRLVEGLALPRESDEFKLRYYNSLTTWITIDRLLECFGLDRPQLADADAVDGAVRRFSQRLPTYITLKDVKKRWGHGHEDIFPVAQFEKLWGDMSALPDVRCGFFVVPLRRGQQLKQQSQLDSWLRDGSAGYVDQLCEW